MLAYQFTAAAATADNDNDDDDDAAGVDAGGVWSFWSDKFVLVSL